MSNLNNFISALKSSDKMPALFVGHGNPMNALEINEFTSSWQQIGQDLPAPKAIVCISAHWETKGTYVTAMEKPRTIHDFGGFPRELFEIQYPAPGDPELAKEIKNSIPTVDLNENWGLDHGAWSVIKHIYPAANIPVLQISIDHYKSPQYHYNLAKELSYLRSKGVLIIGSGNIVHNLREVNWSAIDSGYDWALEADNKIKKLINDRNHSDLIQFEKLGRAFNLSIPTAEHYIPLLYILALQNSNEQSAFFNEKLIMGSLSMTSLIIG